jgi:hypothetical protein
MTSKHPSTTNSTANTATSRILPPIPPLRSGISAAPPTSSSLSSNNNLHEVIQAGLKKGATAPTRKAENLFEPTIEEALEQLGFEIIRRNEMHILLAETKIDLIRGTFAAEMVRIPKRIQDMKVREFAATYKGSIAMVLEHEKRKMVMLNNSTNNGNDEQVNNNNNHDIPGTISRKSARKNPAKMKISEIASRTLRKGGNNNNNTISATPHRPPPQQQNNNNQHLETVAMTPMGQNTKITTTGMASVVAHHKTPHGMNTVFSPVITVAIGSDEKRIVHLTEDEIMMMDEKGKNQASLRLLELQNKMTKLRQQLQQSSKTDVSSSSLLTSTISTTSTTIGDR